jgi:ribosomal protein L16 Arg81 hydroxylase
MLERWMAEGAYRGFVAQRARRAPFADVGVMPAHELAFDWERLGRVLADRASDVLVVRDSVLSEEAAPRDTQELRQLFGRGAGIVVRRAERHDEGLAALAQAFAWELGGRSHIQLFATPAKTRGFGWHYDEEDVCILQTHGAKTYYFRENTGEVEPGRFDFARVRDETSPLMSCTLVARDKLYLPRHMWHAAKADEDSLSVSIGVR